VGKGSYGLAAGAQGCGCCWDGCGDCKGFEGEGGNKKGSNTFTILRIDPYTSAASTIAISKELRHDRHTVSLLTDHMVFYPKYRGKVLVGYVAMLTEAIIRKTCKELDIKIIDMSVSSDHIQLFIQYPPKYSMFYC